jgi:hypothetical protein
MNDVPSEYGLEFLFPSMGASIISKKATGSSSKSSASRLPRSARTACLIRSRCMHRTARDWSVSITPMAFRRRARGSNGRQIRMTIGIERRTIQGDPISSRMPKP